MTHLSYATSGLVSNTRLLCLVLGAVCLVVAVGLLRRVAVPIGILIQWMTAMALVTASLSAALLLLAAALVDR
jgi:hypothetical protein